MRRLPVYLVIDVSGSMRGEPIEAVRNGMQMMRSALLRDPCAVEQAFISVITFSTGAQEATPLTEVASFREPTIEARGATFLGAALKLLAECITRDVVRKGTPEKEADWKPLIFLLTDGEPNDLDDGYRKGLAAFKQVSYGTVVACAAGEANLEVLKEIAGKNVLTLATTNADSIAQYFQFLSSAISTRSRTLGMEFEGLNSLPLPPPEISILTN